ncbi:YjgP/YjgQ family permease [Flavobacteriaceae bacterium PRS1]|nr:YjgP/YjgQ family permease [Flavobacteriaceae bacterium PRS1]
MKILDRYILTTYLKTFFSVFIILMLIFVLQSVWLYITELAGKDLDISVIAKFLVYVTPRLIVLVLPLTILLASIMVFGSFAENYEFAAMKSTGISLQRAMRSLSIFIVGLAITTFFFANNVMPWAEFNFYNLRKNIAKVKPALAIAEGQFNQLGSINIKVDEKSGDRGQYLKGVIIHQKKGNSPGNYTVIISKTGELASSEDSDVLKLVLFDGNFYDALQPKDFKERNKKPFVKSYFEKYTINVDLSNINNVDFDIKDVTTKYSMLNVKELNYSIDSLNKIKTNTYKELATTMYNRSTVAALNSNINPKKTDSVFQKNSIYELFKPFKNVQLIDVAINSVNSTNQIINAKKREIALKEKIINKHIISFYEKFALGFACIILFFIGAPLGALIRKGGFGLPIIIAIILFLTYHFIGIFAKNSAEDSTLNPVIATWLSTLFMLPLSVYLTNRATKDRSLLDLDAVLFPIKKLLSKKEDVQVEDHTLLDVNSEAYSHLLNYSNDKLIDILKNYRQYELHISYYNTALQLLDSRGLSKQNLKFGGNLVNENYENALRYKSAYDDYSRIELVLYITYVVFGVGGLVLNNNGFPTLGPIFIIIGVLSFIIFIIALIKAYINQTNFYKLLENNKASNIIALILLGIPLNFIYKGFFSKKFEDDLKQIR